MQVRLGLPLLVLATLATSTASRAQQDDGDLAAYIALVFTPVGAFAPAPPPLSPTRRTAFVARYGRIDFGDASVNHFAVGVDLVAGPGRIGLTAGRTTCEDCDGNWLAGIDYTHSLVKDKPISVAIRPAIGYSKPSDASGSAVSLAFTVPIGADLSAASGPILTPYIVPGFGIGRVSGGGDMESGSRPMLGAGFAIAGRESNVSAHIGLNKVFVDGGDMLVGVGFSIGGKGPPR